MPKSAPEPDGPAIEFDPVAFEEYRPAKPPAVAPPKGLLAVIVGSAAAGLILSTVSAWEGKRNDPYRDIVGVMTVCYGETKVAMRRYTNAECTAMLEKSLVGYAGPVLARNPELRGRPYQLAAAVSLTYNVGPAAYRRSSVASLFSAGNWTAACDAFLRWNRAGGKVVPGLTRRRADERRLCRTGL